VTWRRSTLKPLEKAALRKTPRRKPAGFTAVEIFQAASENARRRTTPVESEVSLLRGRGRSHHGAHWTWSCVNEGALRPRGPAHCSLFALSDRFHRGHYGRAQLFTENTLYPVVLVLDERRHVVETLRFMGSRFRVECFGALLFALLAAKSPALRPDILSQLIKLGQEAALGSACLLFLERHYRGWMIALVAWTVTASHWTIGQLTMVYLLTFVVGIGRFAHCIAGSAEILSAVVTGSIPLAEYFRWLIPATLGNICGGVLMVSLLNYGQVKTIS